MRQMSQQMIVLGSMFCSSFYVYSVSYLYMEKATRNTRVFLELRKNMSHFSLIPY